MALRSGLWLRQPRLHHPRTVYAVDTTWTNNGAYVVIGGDFTGVNGKFHQNLAWLNLDGSLAAFQPNPVFEGQVRFIGAWIAVLVASSSCWPEALARPWAMVAPAWPGLNPDGTFDTTFRPIVTQGQWDGGRLRCVETDDNVPGKFSSWEISPILPTPATLYSLAMPLPAE